jgi:hypothetical protein
VRRPQEQRKRLKRAADERDKASGAKQLHDDLFGEGGECVAWRRGVAWCLCVCVVVLHRGGGCWGRPTSHTITHPSAHLKNTHATLSRSDLEDELADIGHEGGEGDEAGRSARGDDDREGRRRYDDELGEGR